MKIVIVQKWEESEQSWGVRPDGYSLHLTVDDCERYIKLYWTGMPPVTPEAYSRPIGKPYKALVSNDDFDLMMDSKYGRRLHGIAPVPLSFGNAILKPTLLLVCPNGHSETFTTEGARQTLMGGSYTRVNNMGEVVETHDPNILTQSYRCDVCGAYFRKRWQDGALLPDAEEFPPSRPKVAPKPSEKSY